MPRMNQQSWSHLRPQGQTYLPLQDDRIHYAGQPVALVVAATLDQANYASSRIVSASRPRPIACMPSKNEIASAKVAHLARDGGPYGAVADSVTVDMATVRRRKREMVERQITKHVQIYRTSGAELIMGSGRFLAACKQGSQGLTDPIT
jgi:CO/xanthine dehydrogenase Mo-binding subunit